MKKLKERLIRTGQLINREISFYRAVASDSRCPRISRWLLGGAVVYAISPVDLIPDFIPVIGHLDDLIILPLLIWLAIRMIPREVIAHHRKTFSQHATSNDFPHDAADCVSIRENAVLRETQRHD